MVRKGSVLHCQFCGDKMFRARNDIRGAILACDVESLQGVILQSDMLMECTRCKHFVSLNHACVVSNWVKPKGVV